MVKNQIFMIPTAMKSSNHVYDTAEASSNKICDYFANVGSLMGKNLSNQVNYIPNVQNQNIF